MTSTQRRLLWPALLVLLVGALIWGSWPQQSTSESIADRSARISSDIRCPTCSGLSVAESESPLAISSRAEIASQVTAGQSDEEIRQYFVDRYGNTALMSPPKTGAVSWAWAAPVVLGLVALAGMAFAVRRWRHRDQSAQEPTEEDRALVATAMAEPSEYSGALAEERDFLVGALGKLEAERSFGVLSPEEYRSLHNQQTLRLSAVLRAMAAPPMPPRKLTTWKFSLGKSTRQRVWIGSSLGFVVLVTAALVLTSQDRLSGDSITGANAGDTNSLLARASEQTANAQPASAIQTYDEVLQLDPKNAQALAYRGWLIRLAGLSAQGEQSIDSAITADPTYPDARFFKGFILLRDNNDPAGAIVQFDAFFANNPPTEMASLVEQLRTDAQAQLNETAAATASAPTTAPATPGGSS